MQIDLPNWVSYLQALATPALAVAGATIAWGQLQLAHDRFQYERYDRRLKVFRATNDLLFVLENEVDRTTRAPLDALISFNGQAFEYVFLFDADVIEFIDAVKATAYDYWCLNTKFMRLKASPGDNAKFEECGTEEHKLQSAISNYRNKLIPEFRKYLGPKPPPTWRRWSEYVE